MRKRLLVQHINGRDGAGSALTCISLVLYASRGHHGWASGLQIQRSCQDHQSTEHFLIHQYPLIQNYHDMSSVTTTLLQPSPAAPFPITSLTKTCHQCGADLSQSHPPVAEDAQRRIAELETQVKILTGKATAAGTFFSSVCYLHRLFATWPLHS